MYMCVVFYMPTHTDVLYICMCSQNAPPPRVHAHRWTCTPVHTRTHVNTATRARSHAQTEGMCCQSISKHAGGDFPCLRKGFAFGLTLLVHFRKFRLKCPQKDECTEHGIVFWSSALNLTFLFVFFCLHLTGRDTSFLAWQLCRKIIIPHFVLKTNCAERFYRVLEVEREGGCGELGVVP